jgi:hypothetical protein
MITMTLSAADATAHAIQNPLVPGWMQGQNVPVTLFLLALLGAVFLRGFKEAIGVAVVLVGIYLGLNVVVVITTMPQIQGRPGDTEENPAGRIEGARRLLTTAAVIMSAFLITTSFTTVILIPELEFQP